MIRLPSWPLNLKIADRLTFWFLAISIVPCLALAMVVYRLSETASEDTIHRTLLVTAEQKAAQIETYATERIRSIAAVSNTLTIVGACEQLGSDIARSGASSPGYLRDEEVNRPIMTHISGAYGYPDMLIVNPAGGSVQPPAALAGGRQSYRGGSCLHRAYCRFRSCANTSPG